MKTLVLGASENPQRYSYLATKRLLDAGHEVCLVGKTKGEIFGIPIVTSYENCTDIDTITLYLNPSNQKSYYDFILNKIAPRRIIFNPGTENAELIGKARDQGILVEMACTLVLLSVSSY